jgi:hypothetical protein
VTAPRVATAPIVVSDATALATVGLKPRAFRRVVKARGIPHSVVGRRLLVRLNDFLAGVGLASEQPEHRETAPEPWDEAALLERVAR